MTTETETPLNQIALGDLVDLKSGGPTMTVDSVAPDGKLVCLWFDREGKPMGGQFSPGSLAAAKD